MLQDLTAAMIDHGLAKLRLDQLQGCAPMPGQVSYEEIARYAGVSPHTIKKIEAVALAKLYTLIHSQNTSKP